MPLETAPELILPRVAGSLLTLYMMALLLRWLGPWIEVDCDGPRLRWIAWITDPLIRLIGRILPPMGPMNWAPIAAVISVWILRIALIGY